MKQPSLDQLRDLHLPEPVGVWPLAYGWYIVLIIVAAIVTAAMYVLYKKYKMNLPKKQALKHIEAIEQAYLTDQDAAKAAYQLTIVLKRFCLSYYPRKEVASLHGQQWQQFLGNTDWCQTLSSLAYQKPKHMDLQPVIKGVTGWIKRFKPKGARRV